MVRQKLANIKQPFMRRHFLCACIHGPVGLCLSMSVPLHLNLSRLWFPVTGVRGQLAPIRGQDPHWPSCQLDADKSGCTHSASACVCTYKCVNRLSCSQWPAQASCACCHNRLTLIFSVFIELLIKLISTFKKFRRRLCAATRKKKKKFHSENIKCEAQLSLYGIYHMEEK